MIGYVRKSVGDTQAWLAQKSPALKPGFLIIYSLCRTRMASASLVACTLPFTATASFSRHGHIKINIKRLIKCFIGFGDDPGKKNDMMSVFIAG